jgi:hypothetical protein
MREVSVFLFDGMKKIVDIPEHPLAPKPQDLLKYKVSIRKAVTDLIRPERNRIWKQPKGSNWQRFKNALTVAN